MTLSPVTGAAGRPLEVLSLLGLTALGKHGALAHEQQYDQPFVVDVILHCEIGSAGVADDLSLTVDYGAVARAVVAVIRGPSVALIETLAERIAQVCLEPRRVQAVDVTVHKPQAPVPERFADVAVTIRRARGQVGP